MKHLVLFLIFALTVYVAWAKTPRTARTHLRQKVAKHVLPVALIVAVLIVSLVVMFYLPSLSLL